MSDYIKYMYRESLGIDPHDVIAVNRLDLPMRILQRNRNEGCEMPSGDQIRKRLRI